MAKLKQENVADFLHCASILEERAYLLHRSLADKVNLPLINSLMLHIAFDSRKHSIILKGISESIVKQEKQPRGCEKKLFFGGTWAIIERIAEEIARKERIPREHCWRRVLYSGSTEDPSLHDKRNPRDLQCGLKT